MKVAYVCTNYNNSAFSIEAVRSFVGSMAAHQIEVIVVDNASSSAEVEILKTGLGDLQDVCLLLNDQNLGYFPGLNAGIEQITDVASCDWVVVGNNDLEFPPEFGSKLAENSDRLSEYAVVSPDVITLDGEHQNPHVIKEISGGRERVYDLYYSFYPVALAIQALIKLFKRQVERADEEQWEVAQPIYQGHGSVYLLGKRFFERFDSFWAPTFMMGEEYFLSRQLSEAGMQVFYDPVLQIQHHWHASLDGVPSKKRWELSKEAHKEYRKFVPSSGGGGRALHEIRQKVVDQS